MYIPEIVDIAPALPHGKRDRMIGFEAKAKNPRPACFIGFDLLITRYKYQKLYGFTILRHGLALGEQTTQLTARDAGTLVTMSYERLGRFWIQQLLHPLISWNYNRALTALKLAVEGGY